MRRLLVVDREDLQWIDEVSSLTAPGDEWDVLPIGPPPELLARRGGERLGRLGSWRIVRLEPFSRTAHELVGEFVVDYVRRLPDQDLGGTSLAALLAEPRANRWWYLETSEKSPWRSRLIATLYRLALVWLAVRAVGYDEVRLALSDDDLAGVLAAAPDGFPPVRVPERRALRRSSLALVARSLWSAWLTLRSFAFTKVILAVAGWSPPHLRSGEVAMLSNYPYFWVEPFWPRATERFFAVPPEGAYYMAWLASMRALWHHRRSVAVVLRDRRIAPLQWYLGLGHAIATLAPAPLAQLVRFLGLRGRIQARFLGFDVGALVAHDVARSLTAVTFFEALLLREAARAFAIAAAPGAVLFRAEFQPFERALLSGLDGRVRTVGFRHTPFGLDLLSHRFAAGELSEYLARRRLARDMPLPDAFLVAGPVGLERLVADGFPPARIAIAGPQRYPALLGRGRSRDDPSSARRDVLLVYVALSVSAADTDAMLAALAEACAGRGDVRLVVKTHPSLELPRDALTGFLSEVGLEGAYTFGSAQPYEDLARADVVVTVSSTLVFEAMAMGAMPIVFENPATFNANSLLEFVSSLYLVRNAEELGAALREVLDGSPGATRRRGQWPGVLRRVFHDLETPLDVQLASALAQLGVEVRPSPRLPGREASAP